VSHLATSLQLNLALQDTRNIGSTQTSLEEATGVGVAEVGEGIVLAEVRDTVEISALALTPIRNGRSYQPKTRKRCMMAENDRRNKEPNRAIIHYQVQ